MTMTSLRQEFTERIYETADNPAEKFDLIFDLSEHTADLLPPVYILSHNRHDNTPTLRTLPVLQDLGTLVVAEEESAEYAAAHPHVEQVYIPAGYGGFPLGLGRAKQFSYEYSAQHDLGDHAIFMDDDLVSLTVLYTRENGKGASHAYAQRIGKENRLRFFEGVLVLNALIGMDLLDTRPNIVKVAPQCNAANRTTASAGLIWETNRGGPPSQLVTTNPRRFLDVTGGYDLESFNWHGEDIGSLSQILEGGGAVARVPSILGHYWDYETRSVIRTPETAPALRLREHEELMKRPLARFLNTRYDLIGNPQWHSFDWPALEKAGLIEPSVQQHWKPAPALDLI